MKTGQSIRIETGDCQVFEGVIERADLEKVVIKDNLDGGRYSFPLHLYVAEPGDEGFDWELY